MKKLLKASFIALMMVGSLASCTDGVSGTTVAAGQGSTTPTPTQPKEDGKMTVEEAKTYADAHYSQDKVAEKYNQGEAVINYDLKDFDGHIDSARPKSWGGFHNTNIKRRRFSRFDIQRH